jgi:hypothetical protein
VVINSIEAPVNQSHSGLSRKVTALRGPTKLKSIFALLIDSNDFAVA